MKRLTTFALLVLVSGVAFAKTPKKLSIDDFDKPRLQESEEVPVPQSQVHLEHYAVPERVAIVHNIELNFSNWSPNDLGGDSSQVSSTGNFHASGTQVSLNYWQNTWAEGPVTISPKFGLSFSQLARNGKLNVLGHEDDVRQSMNVYSLRAGVEVAPIEDLSGHFQPFFDLSILPTWEQIERSDYSNSNNRTALAVEELAGVAWRSPWAAGLVDARNIGFEIGVQGTQASSLGGFGIFAGSRLEL